MPTGKVKWFDAQKGYGFIRPDDGSPDVFVHIREVERARLDDLKEGQKISFDIVMNQKNNKAAAENLRSV